ncbi:MAG: hypothetical protein HQL18_00990 [Candidatus Omnitrophica bacterium]|nr:hypothetical protein [Candidatus Omnitrophota bacterium]
MVQLSLFILGFTSIISQVVMARELMVSFYGNEFFIGWILFAWLFWVAMGSLLAKFLDQFFFGPLFLVVCHVAVAVLVPLGIFLARIMKTVLLVAPGQIPDILPSIFLAFLVLAPLCLALGFQFTAVCQYWADNYADGDKRSAVGSAYLFETVGFVVGGILFSYGLVHLNEFHVSAILAGINLIAIFFLLSSPGKVARRAMFLCLTLGILLTAFIYSSHSRDLNNWSTALRFPKERLVETRNSLYGNLTVTEKEGRHNFYQNGLFVGTDREDVTNEYLVHFAMLSHPAPKKVLLVGAGFNGAVAEILKHSPEVVFYAEMDPELVDLARKYLSPAMVQVLNDRRVHILTGDVRSFLDKLSSDLDVVILNFPNPSTALVNRYFTKDFFQMLRSKMKPNGIVSTHLAFSANAVSVPLGDLGAAIFRTIKGVFPSVMILPEDTLFFIASAGELKRDPKVLAQRLRERAIRNSFVVEQYILYRYRNDRVASVENAFTTNVRAGVNSDLRPRGYLYNLIQWVDVFHHALATTFAAMARIPCFLILGLGLLLVTAPYFIPFREGARRYPLTAGMAVGGFSLMAAEIVVIYGFQVFFGNLYYSIVWIITVFMAGMASGAFWGNRLPQADSRHLVRIHALIAAYFLVWMILMGISQQYQWTLPQIFWFLFSFGIGGLVGTEFSLVNRLSFANRGGLIYAADLFGSGVGAIVVSVFMLPVYGVQLTFLFLVLVNAVAGGMLYLSLQK